MKQFKQPLVSVIVPVHNAGDFLSACLDSISNQSYDNIEVICIDDESTDDSLQTMQAYEARDKRVHVVGQEQAGVSTARNNGLEKANGEYVLFVDADDLIETCLVEHAIAVARQQEAELCIFGFDEYYANAGVFRPRELCSESALYDGPFSLADVEGPSTNLVTPNVWRILFKAGFLRGHGLRFHEDLATSEDLAFIYEALFCARRISLLGERLYHYRRDGGSTLTHARRGTDGLKALGYIGEFADERGMLEGEVLRQFVNLVCDVLEYALSTAFDHEEFLMLFTGFHAGWSDLVVRNHNLVDVRYKDFLGFALGGASECLFGFLERSRRDAEAERVEVERLSDNVSSLEAQLVEARDDALAARAEVEALRSSRSYRFGNFFMRWPAKVRARFSGR